MQRSTSRALKACTRVWMQDVSKKWKTRGQKNCDGAWWHEWLTRWWSGPARCRRCWSCRRKLGSRGSKRSFSWSRKTTSESWSPDTCDLPNASQACLFRVGAVCKAANLNYWLLCNRWAEARGLPPCLATFVPTDWKPRCFFKVGCGINTF